MQPNPSPLSSCTVSPAPPWKFLPGSDAPNDLQDKSPCLHRNELKSVKQELDDRPALVCPRLLARLKVWHHVKNNPASSVQALCYSKRGIRTYLEQTAEA